MTTVANARSGSWFTVVLLAAVSLAAAGSAVTVADAQSKEFRVGVAISLRGIISRDAALFKVVYDLWADTVNRGGGV